MRWNEFRSHIRHLPAKDQTRVEKAFEMGKELHKDQKRKSGEPYFIHPIAVADMLADMGADADTLIAALLHDSVEDTPITLDIINKKFDGSVRQLIDGVTKLEPEEFAEQPTKDDQIETLRKMFTLMEKDVRIMVIKLVDRLHNMQTIEHLSPKKQQSMAQETLEIYVRVADRLCMWDIRDELEGLCQSILDAKIYKELYEQISEREQSGAVILRHMEDELKEHDPKSLKGVEIQYENKSWGKMHAQWEADGKAVTGISDYSAVFVCKDLEVCYLTLGLLHQTWKQEALSFQDYINGPMTNGYRGLHTTIILENGVRVRCKIRTPKMQQYARQGIASVCFDNEAKGLMEYVTWAKHISPLAKDTKQHSEEFWDGLKSDILGESIVIHGPGDETVLIPKDSTALDAMFYLFGKEAEKTKTISVNGKESPFQKILVYGDSISADIGKKSTVTRSWIQSVNTAFAIATIRSTLSGQSQQKKLTLGKEMLQSILTEKKSGFIEEFSESGLMTGITSLGFNSLDDVYLSIASGHTEPSVAYDALFSGKGRLGSLARIPSIIDLTIDLENIESVTGSLRIYKKYKISLRHLRLRPFAMMKGKVSIKHPLTLEEQESLAHELEAVGATDVHIRSARSDLKVIFGIMALPFLWGFDPAIAHILINAHELSPVDLTLIRFWSLTGISAVLVLWKKVSNTMTETRLPIRSRSLWASVMLLIAISLSTYSALQSTQPIHYSIPMTAAGLVLTSVVNKKRTLLLGMTWALILAGTALIVTQNPEWSNEGIVFTFMAIIAFGLFSMISERYKRKENVGARSAQYFFVLSVLGTILTLPLLFISHISSLSAQVVGQMFLFSVIFAGLPYYVYYYMLSHREIDFVLRYSFLIIFTTGIAQILLRQHFNSVNTATYIAGGIVTLGAILPLLMTGKEK